MSEKRFTIIHIGNPYECVIKDHDTNNTIGMFDSTTQPVNEVVDLLNELHEENQELRKDVIYWRHKALNKEPVNHRCRVDFNE